MGVDAWLFAKTAKRYVDVDRLHNIGSFGVDEQPHAEAMFRLGEAYGVAVHDKSVNIHWLKAAIEFVRAHPGDTFFYVSDHQEPSMWDVASDGSYREWKP